MCKKKNHVRSRVQIYARRLQLKRKLRLRAYSHLKGGNLLIIINLETTVSKYFTKQYIILYLCTDQNHYTCSESGKKTS